MRSRSTQLQSVNYLMLMCRVRGVGLQAFAIAVQASLSSYNSVALDCGMPKSHKILWINKIVLPASFAPMKSASVEDPAIVG